jgi:hypothetical protein
MRALVIVSLVVALVAGLAASAIAEDREALKRELEQMRQRFEQMQQDYQQALQSLTERLQRLEAGPRAAAAPPTPTPPPAPSPTLLEYAQPRAPFVLGERGGRGQLLFDLGVVADFVANLTQHNVDRADAGTVAGRENRFVPREIELMLFGRIDPYAEGVLRMEFAEEFEDGERVTEAELAEAHLTLLTLPYGTKVRLGQMPVRFGLLSPLHREALPQPDPPNVLLRFLGEEQFRERGLEVSWVAPLPVYLEAVAGVFNGDNETAFGRGSLRDPLVTGRLRSFFELGDASAIQLGASAAIGRTEARHRQVLAGVDAKYKLTPDGWRHPLLTVGGEGLWSFRRAEVEDEIAIDVDTDGDGLPDTTETVTVIDTRTRDRVGWYAWAEVQPARRWAGGVRYDWTQFLEAAGREWAVEPYLAFMPSDFLRFRLAYKHTERDRREPFSANGATARIVDELLFQATFFLGAHQPHPF